MRISRELLDDMYEAETDCYNLTSIFGANIHEILLLKRQLDLKCLTIKDLIEMMGEV